MKLHTSISCAGLLLKQLCPGLFPSFCIQGPCKQVPLVHIYFIARNKTNTNNFLFSTECLFNNRYFGVGDYILKQPLKTTQQQYHSDMISNLGVSPHGNIHQMVIFQGRHCPLLFGGICEEEKRLKLIQILLE